MKFFHLSDLHIGLRLMNHDLTGDQAYIFRQIAARAAEEQPDAIVIAGDLYDKPVPSQEAVRLLDSFVNELREAAPGAEIMMISGNHDSAQRIDLFRSVLEKEHLHMVGFPPRTEGEHIEKVTLRDEWGRVNFYLLPFVRPSMLSGPSGREEAAEEGSPEEDTTSGSSMLPGTSGRKRAGDEESAEGDTASGFSMESGRSGRRESGGHLSYEGALRMLLEREEIRPEERNVLVSHQFYLPAGVSPESVERMDSEIVKVGNIDAVSAEILEPFDYAALGHIHKPMKVGEDRFRYCGTPLACSVSEAGQEKGILLVELGKKEPDADGHGFRTDLRIRKLPLVPLREVRVVRGTEEEVLKHGTDDFVSVRLTGEGSTDAADLRDRIRKCFPNLLEIRRETVRAARYEEDIVSGREMDAFELCTSFLPDLDEEEKDLLKEVIQSIGEA